MKKSMTAYGRATLQTSHAHWTIEISSVNRKGLDLQLALPPELVFLDPILRGWVAEIATRGSITIRLSYVPKESVNLVKQLKVQKKKWEHIASELGYSSQEISLSFLLQNALKEETLLDETVLTQEVGQLWKKGAKAWLTMRQQEGKSLIKDIEKRVEIIEQLIKGIERDVFQLKKEAVLKLSKRMEELSVKLDPQQLAKEAALQVDRSDTTEEIVRLTSHIEQMKLYLKSSEPSVGKTLDFLSQEMGREIGTLMAKVSSSKVTPSAIKIKSEVEKIREQVQNIE